jgi:phosphatidylglycerophosphate synthase
MTWVCDIPGATTAVSAMHFAVHVGLAAFVVGGGLMFLAFAVIAYRQPIDTARRRDRISDVGSALDRYLG